MARTKKTKSDSIAPATGAEPDDKAGNPRVSVEPRIYEALLALCDQMASRPSVLADRAILEFLRSQNAWPIPAKKEG